MIALQTIALNTPFSMPDIRFPDFSDAPVFNISDFGAIVGKDINAQIANQRALNLAISAAHEVGGGTVYVGPGTYACAKIHLKSFVNLHIAKDAKLLFSGLPDDYLPPVNTSWEGMECLNYSPLIYADNCECIGISGTGTLQANMELWTEWGARPEAHMQALANLYHQMSTNTDISRRLMVFEGANLRPQFIQFTHSKHILIEGITIKESPFWLIHPLLCEHVVVRKIKLSAHGHNSDGIDPEMTQNMLIEDCVFDQGDDAIALKAGRNQDGWRIGVPTKNIVIRNCHIKRAHHLLAIGSELAAGIENVLIENCQFDEQTDYADAGNLLYIKTNERCGGYVRHIFMRDIQAKTLRGSPLVIETDVLYQWRHLVPTYERRLTKISDIHVEYINAQQAEHLCCILDQAELPVSRVNLNNINISKIMSKQFIGNTDALTYDNY